jgi:hypothetical protein
MLRIFLDGKTIAAATPKQVMRIGRQNGQAFAFSQDGALLALGDSQGAITLYAAQSGWGQLASFQARAGDVRPISFLPGGVCWAAPAETAR